MVKRVLFSEMALQAMKLNDLFVQEIAATLVAALIRREHAWPTKDIRSYREEALRHLAPDQARFLDQAPGG